MSAWRPAVYNALTALKAVLKMKKGEKALIISEGAEREVAEIFALASLYIGAEVRLIILPKLKRPVREVPRVVLRALSHFRPNLVLNILKRSVEETPFRIKLLQTEKKFKPRIGHMIGVNMRMLTEGPLAISESEYRKMQRDAEKVRQIFEGADLVKIKAPAGTEAQLSIKSRKWRSDTKITRGVWGNLPCGEAWIAPIESSLHGTVVCDGAVGDLGVPPNPVHIYVEQGRIKKLTCENRRFLSRLEKALATDKWAKIVGEFGIGFNPKASTLAEELIEAEKAAETIHIAFGRNIDMGGKNQSATHRDFLIKKPTVTVTYVEGVERRVMVDGKIVV